jgi:glutamyl-tRNA synthetase/glutamyl-Q tRNA(Asp) synthetase
VYVWGIARHFSPQGRVLLRIEDHDRHRSRSGFESAILEDLAWLGFAADGPFVRQSERGAEYQAALDRLRAQGLVYACACSRAEIGPHREGGIQAVPSELKYPGTCAGKHLPETKGVGLRVRLAPSVERFDDWRHGPQEQRPSDQCGDLLVRDRDGNWTYQFAAAVDDWRQGVTLVIRGDDLLASTGRQLQLARLLGRADPPSFLHHPLVMKTATQKLSKSDGDTGIRALRLRGWTPAQVIGHAAALAGLAERSATIGAGDVGQLFQNFVRATTSS